MPIAQDVVDAIAADLDANAALATHTTVKYRRPRAILPADCPLLVVWLSGKGNAPQTTQRYDGEIVVGVSWHEQTVQEAQTLARDNTVALALLTALDKIEARVRHYGLNGIGVLAAWQVLPGDVLYLPPEMEQGLTEGYALEVNVRVTEG